MEIEPTVKLWNYTIRITYKSYYIYIKQFIYFICSQNVYRNWLNFFFNTSHRMTPLGAIASSNIGYCFRTDYTTPEVCLVYLLLFMFFCFTLYRYRTQRNGNLVLRLLLTIFQGIIEQLRVEWRSLTPILLFILLYIYDITITPILMRAILMF